MSVGPGKSIAYSRKLLRWPATLGITGTRMQGHQRFLPFRHDLPGFVHIRLGEQEARFKRVGGSTYKRDNLQIAQNLRLEVDVGYPPIKGNGIWGFQANRDFRPQVEQERVGITTTPMDLESQIKVLLPHGFKKPLLLNRIVSIFRGFTYPFRRRKHNHAINWSGPACQEGSMPPTSKEHDLRLIRITTCAGSRRRCDADKRPCRFTVKPLANLERSVKRMLRRSSCPNS